jgi:hypothetical protein
VAETEKKGQPSANKIRRRGGRSKLVGCGLKDRYREMLDLHDLLGWLADLPKNFGGFVRFAS